MAFWHRIGKSNLKTAYIQFSRCYIHPSLSISSPKPRPNEIPHSYSFFHGRPTCVRFFAAPVQFQVKPKNGDDDPSGQRLNDQIKAKYVRLVRDDGEHSVVSRFEALERARNLKLDLVEVQKNANPPVCKIMDFHKEMYKRQERDKERAKSKAGVRLRNECKEVRISVKTESKDISMKADMVKKLLEKGYRVKCKAMGNEDQDTMASISRLMALMEDVYVVESGPHLTKKEAFIIVRHVKYGPAKRGAKKLQDAAHMAVKAGEGDAEQLTTSSVDSIQYVNQSSAEAWSETKDERPSDSDKQFSHLVDGSDKTINGGNDSVSPAMLENRYKRAADENKVRSNAQVPPAVTENRYKRAADENKVRSNAQVPPAVTENRYKRAEPRNRFQQTPPNTGPEIRDSDGRIPLNLNRTRHVPGDANVNPRVENTRQPFNGPPGSRNSMPLREDIPRHPRAPNTTSPGYGRFSNPNGPQTAGMHRNREGKSQYSTWQLSGWESR